MDREQPLMSQANEEGILLCAAISENSVLTHIPRLGPYNTQHLLGFLNTLYRDIIPENETIWTSVVLFLEVEAGGDFAWGRSGCGSSLSGEGGPVEVADQGTPAVKEVGTAARPVTLPQFVPFSVESTPGSKVEARLKVRLARFQLEKEERERDFQFRRELELKKLEADTAVRLRQVELQARTTPAGEAPPVSLPSITFDVTKHISLVPVFREAEVETYFGAFERIAAALRWPEDVWAILLQCRLTGRAQEACSSLSVEDGLNYDKVKGAILRAYELVPEAYRQRFRNLRKTSNQTHIDFAREKGILFDRWCAACKADNFASVRELMLLEEFKSCVSERTAVYLNEQKVSTLQQAATLADEFALTHKSVLAKRESSREVLLKSGSQVSGAAVPSVSKADRKCFYCHKSGHLIADCVAWKCKQPVARPPKGVGLIKTSISSETVVSEVPEDCFRPFIFKCWVSLAGQARDQRLVTALRDTACSQSLILSSVLPSGAESDASAVVRGIEMGFIPAPLHRIHVQSDLATGYFHVGVRPCFPISGVDFIMGNDIAGGKVYPVPKVVAEPIPETYPDELAEKHPDVFMVSVLTRAKARGQAQDQEVDLADSLFLSVLSQDELPPGGGSEDGGFRKPEQGGEPVASVALAAPLPLNREALIAAQQTDQSLAKCMAAAVKESSECTSKQPYFLDDGVLMRRWASQSGRAAVELGEDWGWSIR
ncbi:uncharacterized protein LOC125016018 [Mugil cephalus]|uniref:uncharacterized protein LOC125016018 n=1 Tax=Mugil cephalus TaxID=48193 RepID=UPI001FB64236|nr:uncharacterized protein LOC125016018 [Mugil cephalus]